MSATKTISKFIFSILALCASVGAANATTITGTFNSMSYQTVSLNVATASTVDLQYISGYYDPNFVLFNGAGNHIISNDDSNNNLFSHLTQNLAAGNYTLLVTYCCGGVNAAAVTATFSNTDGFNPGTYWIGGSETLASVEAYLNNLAYGGLSGTQFTIGVNNAAVSVPTPALPEPQSLALFGLALAALSLARRRKLGSK
jgi:hypothetical protein